ncbi:Unknown protein sequence [Pseudomonas coronafaciens pv. zizaniae]|nr:Unknown protein sequence [Pseudomonas coronafaciens pv. zizaniae]
MVWLAEHLDPQRALARRCFADPLQGSVRGNGITADLIAFFATDQQPASVGGHSDIARLLFLDRIVFNKRHLATGRVNLEDRHAAGGPLTGEQPLVIRRQTYVRSPDARRRVILEIIVACIAGLPRRQVQALWNAGCLAGLLQRSGFPVYRKGGDGAAHFAHYVQKSAVGREREMAWAGILWNCDKAFANGHELAVLGLKPILQDAIDPEIACIDEAIARVGAYRMRMHAGLVGLNTVARTMLRIDRLNTEQVSAIRSAEQEAPTAVSRKVRQTLRQGCLTQRFQMPRYRLNGEAQHLIRLCTQRSKQCLAVRRDGHRIDLVTRLCLLHEAECPALLVQPVLRDQSISRAGNVSEGGSLNRQTERTTDCCSQHQGFSHDGPFYCCGVIWFTA